MAQGSQNPATGSNVPSLPENFEPLVFAGWGGIDTKPKRPAVEDGKVPWMTNLIPLGPNNLRAVPDVGAAFYTTTPPRTIVYFDFFFINPGAGGAEPCVAVFLDDGSAIQIGLNSSTRTTIAAASTFAPPSGTEIVCRQYGTQYLLIATEQSLNSYWVWDGTLLYTAGTVSPEVDILDSGRSYTTLPTITVLGGTGTGATFAATIANGAIETVTATAAGSGWLNTDPSDVILLFSGGGGPTSAYGTVGASNGAITAIEIISGGSGFTSIPGIVITDGTGTGAQAVVTGVSGGTITGIKVIDCGTNYSAPTISTSGGGGSGLNATAVISYGVLDSPSITNGGGPYLTAPDVHFLSATGSGASAKAIINASGVVTGLDFGFGAGAGFSGTGYINPTYVYFSGGQVASATAKIMPFGIHGSSIEVYQSRAWIATITGIVKTFFTAAGSAVNFNPADGAGAFPPTESVLTYKWAQLLQSNGFLYMIGDSSINNISGIQTSASGSSETTTTVSFSNLNTDPSTGSPWRDSAITFDRGIIFANQTGVYALYGGAVSKISDELDGVFNAGNLSHVTNSNPSSAKATIFNTRFYALLLPITDPVTGSAVNALLCRDARGRWFPVESQISFVKIKTQEIDSNITAWGNSGTSLYKLFTTFTNLTTKFVQSKLYGVGNIIDQKKSWQIWAFWQSEQSATLTFTQDSENAVAAANQGAFASSANSYGWGVTRAAAAVGYTLGWSMSSTSPQFTLMNVTLGQQDYRRRT